MNILAFDTCFDACSVAVQGRERALVSERQIMRRGHAEALMPMIARVMQASNLEFHDLDRIAVTHGPGTFTGARVGMSAALGIAFAHKLPVVTLSSLACIAAGAARVLGPSVNTYAGIVVARDARRDSVYIEMTDIAGGTAGGPFLLSIDAARDQISRQSASKLMFGIGSGISLLVGDTDSRGLNLSAAWPSTAQPPEVAPDEPNARDMIDLAMTTKPAEPPRPLYLRPPDATPSSTPPLARITAEQKAPSGA